MPTVDLEQVSIAYDVTGGGDSIPIVLVSGCGGPAAGWFALVPALAGAGYRVVSFDNRGMAPSSSPPAPYTIGDMVADTLGLCDHLDIDRAIFVGHSMGGWVAEVLAADHPERVIAAAFLGSCNVPTSWERLITTAERDLARLDVELPVAFSRRRSAAVPAERRVATRRDRRRVDGAPRRDGAVGQPGPARAVRSVSRMVPHRRSTEALGRDHRSAVSSSRSSTTSTRRRRVRARRRRRSPMLPSSRSWARVTSLRTRIRRRSRARCSTSSTRRTEPRHPTACHGSADRVQAIGAGVVCATSHAHHSSTPSPVRALVWMTRALGFTSRRLARNASMSKSRWGSRSILLTTTTSAGAEHHRVLERLLLALGDRVHHRLGVLADVELGRAHEVADVLDHQQVELLEREPAEARAHHHRVEMAFAAETGTGVDERNRGRVGVELVRVEAGGDVTFEDADAEPTGRAS